MTMTVDQANRAESEYWRTHRRDDARPEWDDLTPQEQVEQIRLWDQSEFFDAFEDDPTVVANCPEHGPQVITADDTECDECSRDLVNLTPSFDNYMDWFA